MFHYMVVPRRVSPDEGVTVLADGAAQREGASVSAT